MDELYKDDPDDEIVGNTDSVPVEDCEFERVPQGDAVAETDTVPHAVAEGVGEDVDETDGQTVLLVKPETDAQEDAETADDGENVVDVVGNVDNV